MSETEGLLPVSPHGEGRVLCRFVRTSRRIIVERASRRSHYFDLRRVRGRTVLDQQLLWLRCSNRNNRVTGRDGLLHFYVLICILLIVRETERGAVDIGGKVMR